MENSIIVDQVRKSYKGKLVLDDITMKIDKPGVYLIAGPNGSGKTTLLEIIVGIRKQNAGKVWFDDKKNNRSIHHNIGFLTQLNTLRKTCYLREEIKLVKEIYGITIDEKQYLESFGLGEYYYQKVKELSGGTIRRALLAMLLMVQNDILILDEPASGLDAFNRNEIWNVIKDYSKDKIVLVSDHYLNQAAEYSDYIYLIDKGKIVRYGSRKEIMQECSQFRMIKSRGKEADFVRKKLENFSYEEQFSGSVHHFFIPSKYKKQLDELYREDIIAKELDFEDLYFYYTGNVVRES